MVQQFHRGSFDYQASCADPRPFFSTSGNSSGTRSRLRGLSAPPHTARAVPCAGSAAMGEETTRAALQQILLGVRHNRAPCSRWVLEPEDVILLERVFALEKCPGRELRQQLSEHLNVTSRQVQVRAAAPHSRGATSSRVRALRTPRVPDTGVVPKQAPAHQERRQADGGRGPGAIAERRASSARPEYATLTPPRPHARRPCARRRAAAPGVSQPTCALGRARSCTTPVPSAPARQTVARRCRSRTRARCC